MQVPTEGMTKFLPPQDILKGRVWESCVSVTNPTSIHSPEPAKPLEGGSPVGIKSPKELHYSYEIPVSETVILPVEWFYQFILLTQFHSVTNSVQL